MAIGATEYNYDGIHILKAFKITTHVNEEYDLIGIVGSFSVYEDMFSTNITCTATIVDTTNTLMNLSILGNEKVFIELALPNEPKNLKYTFYVNAILNKEKAGTGKEIYTMELISEDAFKNIMNVVSKSFENKFYHQMIQELHSLHSSKTLEVENSEGTWTLPLSYTKPVKAINMVSRYAKSEEFGQPSYMYFEREDAYWWKTIDVMMKGEPKTKYKVIKKDMRPALKQQHGSVGNTSMARQDQDNAVSPDKIKYNKYFDLIDAMSYGMFDSELIHVDMENKKFERKSFKYLDEFNKRDQNGLHTKDMKGSPLPQGKSDLSSARASSSNRIHMFPVQNEKGRPEMGVDKLIRDGRLKEIDFCRITLDVPGNPWVHAGDIIDIQLISDEGMKTDAQVAPKEKYHKGKFIVTAIAHHVDQGKWMSMMELATDNLDSKFDEAIYTLKRPRPRENISQSEENGHKIGRNVGEY